MNYCKCECGTEIADDKMFALGHNSRVKEYTGGQFKPGHIQSKETILKRIEKLKGQKRTEECKQNLSNIRTEAWKDPEYRKNCTEGLTGRKIKFKISGDSYSTWHNRAHAKHGPIVNCDVCGLHIDDYREIINRKFDAHCVSGNYRDLERSNWVFCCTFGLGGNCHGIMEGYQC